MSGMMSQLLNGSTARIMQVTDPDPTALTTMGAEIGKQYTVNGTAAEFLCATSIGNEVYASFRPLAGGPPLLVARSTVIKPIAAPLVVPADAPKSDPALAAKPAPGTAPAPEVKVEAPPAASMPATPSEPPKTPTVGDLVAKAGLEVDEAAFEKAEKAAKAKTAKAAKKAAESLPGPIFAADGVCLYVNCAPVGVATQTLHAYVEQLQKMICEASQTPVFDFRSANDNAFGFGKWKGYLAQAAVTNPPPPGHYVAMTGGDERLDCVTNALIPMARTVIG